MASSLPKADATEKMLLYATSGVEAGSNPATFPKIKLYLFLKLKTVIIYYIECDLGIVVVP